MLGTNDAILAASGFADTYETNLRAFWGWWSKRNPTAALIVAPPGPLGLAANETNAATLRARAASVVAAIGAPRLKLVQIGGAFDRTVSSFYRPSDQVHWSDAGHAAVAATLQAGLSVAGITL